MTSIGVLQFPYQGKVIRDALGKELTGWTVVEDGHPGYPSKDRETAIANARAMVSIRCARHIVSFLVIASDGTKETITL